MSQKGLEFEYQEKVVSLPQVFADSPNFERWGRCVHAFEK
jgi:hypothetical protein